MCRRVRGAFTLVELLVVIAVMVILITMLFPAISIVEEKANRTKCLNNLHQIAIGGVQQFGELGDKLPYVGSNDKDSGMAAEILLPYVKNMVEIFHCPANPGYNKGNADFKLPSYNFWSDYQFNSFFVSFGSNEYASKKQNKITDSAVAAYAFDFPYCPSSAHESGINVAYLDGHAAWLGKGDFGLSEDCTAMSGVKAFFQKGHEY